MDELTGLANPQAFHDAAADLERDAAAGMTAWLVLADVRDFKSFNDRHGHAAGDDALTALAGCFERALPEAHVTARVGGDELAAILVDVPLGAARASAEAARGAVEALPLPSPLTVNVGVAGWLPATEEFAAAFGRAGMAVYAARCAGGNRVHVDGVD